MNHETTESFQGSLGHVLTAEDRRARGHRSLIIAIPALLISIVYVLIAGLYANKFHYTATESQNLTLPATRGQTISLTINVAATGIKGYWASSNGFSLKLNGVGSIQVVPPKSKSWNSTILVPLSQTSQVDQEEITVEGEWMLPASIAGPERRTLDGMLTGDIIFPVEAGFLGFQDHHDTIHIPVHIEIFPLGSAPWLGDKIMLYTTALLGMLLYVFMHRLLRIYDERTEYIGVFFDTSLGARKYYQDVWGALFIVGLLYGGGLILAIALIAGNSTVPCLLEIYGLAVGLILVALGTVIVTAILKKREE